MFQIHLIVDQINQLVQSKIDESEAPAAPAAAASITNYDQTQIEVTLPLVNGQDRHDIESKLLKYFCDYAVFATHIEFQFNDEYLNKGYKIPQAQRISPKWKNHSSGHYYSRKQFYDLILGLENNDSVIYSILYKTFREPSNMPKSELNQMSVGQLKHSPAHINQLYDELRDAMVPATTLALRGYYLFCLYYFKYGKYQNSASFGHYYGAAIFTQSTSHYYGKLTRHVIESSWHRTTDSENDTNCMFC